MTLDEILRDIHAMKENLLVFERKYSVPTEVFFEAYQQGEEPEDSSWVLDWGKRAATNEILQERILDLGLAKAIMEGEKGDFVSDEQIMETLEG
jgi:hypothetical protein